jgi:MFS family permease
MLAGGLLVTAGCMLAAAIGSATVAIAALFVSSIASGATSANLFATGQTLAGPSAAGRWVGFQNCIGNLAGIIAPALTGFLVDRSDNFNAAFGIAAGVALFGVLCWSVLLGRIEVVAWEGGTVPPVVAA